MNNLEDLKKLNTFEINLSLYNASMEGNKDKVKYILKKLKTDLDSVNSSLQNACAKNQLQLVKYLIYTDELWHNADVNYNRQIAFVMACEGGLETMEYLFPLLKFKDEEQKKYLAKESIYRAATHGNLDGLEYLLSKKIITDYFKIEEEAEDLLTNSGFKGNVNVFKYLLNLNNHKEVFLKNEHTNQALSEIVLKCFMDVNLEMADYLLKHDELKNYINIHSQEDYIFKFMCENDSDEVIEYLIMDLNIEKTKDIEIFLQDPDQNKYKKLFEARELQNEMSNSSIKVKKSKI